MKNIICHYDSENERVTIRADDAVIGELREIKVDNVAFVVQSLIRMYQVVFNIKIKEYEQE
ncbi:MAG: hypothetical protein IJ413_09160 [Bacteroides sp.]|nr:hypothetical protein [Bacteroides sp.]